MDELLAALKRARTLEARGTVEVTVLFPPRDTPTRAAAALPRVPFRPALLARNFEVRRVGEETIARRPATRYELTPKVGQAARWTLWIDTQWNIPLAYQEDFQDGTVARRAAFLKVNARPAAVRVALPSAPEGLRRALLAALPGLRLPAGTQPVAVRGRPNGGLEVSLTDGLNVFALVVSPRGCGPRRASPRAGWGRVRVAGGQSAAGGAGQRSGRGQPRGAGGAGNFLKADASNP